MQDYYNEDFLQIISSLLHFARWFGVAGAESWLWKTWGVLLFIFLLGIECGALWKVIKVLSGWASSSVGHSEYSVSYRSITARLAGAAFYAVSMCSLAQTWRFAVSWRKISAYWVYLERSVAISVPADIVLKRHMVGAMFFVVICSLVEHIMSMVSVIGVGCPPELILKRYILTSHAFLFLPSDYTLWVAIPVFFLSKIATLLWNFLDLLIILISMGLTSRYVRLNECVARICAWEKKDNSSRSFEKTFSLKVYSWRKVREAFVKQADLVRAVDSSVGGLIFLSNCSNFYFICLQLFLGLTHTVSNSPLNKFYYSVSLVWLCARIICVVLAASDVNVHSRRALRHLYSYRSRCYNTEVQRLIYQLNKDRVALSGMGFFTLNRNILLKMAGAIITYELVLIQFDYRGFGDHDSVNGTDH